MRQFFFFRSSLFVAMLVGFCATMAQSAPPQIIEVHKDTSLPDEIRLNQFRIAEKINANYKVECLRDTSYWVFSKHIYPTYQTALRTVPAGLVKKIKPRSSRESDDTASLGPEELPDVVNGMKIIEPDLVPQEFSQVYGNHFMLLGFVGNCSDARSSKLEAHFGAQYINHTEDGSCAIQDSIDVVDSVLPANRQRAANFGKMVHTLIPKVKNEPFEFSSYGIGLILGACREKKFISSISDVLDSNFVVIRYIK